MPTMTTPTPDTETPADLATRLLRIMSTPPDGYLLEGSGCPLHDDGGPGPAPSYWALADLRVAAYPEQPPNTQGEKNDPAEDKIRRTLRAHLVAQDLAAVKKLPGRECTCRYASVNADYDDVSDTTADPYDEQADSAAKRRDADRQLEKLQATTAYTLTARGRDYVQKHWPPQRRPV